MARRGQTLASIQTQDIDILDQSDIDGTSPPGPQEASPSVLPAARRRGKTVPINEPAPLGMDLNVPPPFSGILQLEPKDFKSFQKSLKKHKGCSNLKKLTCLDYFISRFSEICYFEVQNNLLAQTPGLRGVLGYGNVGLVTQIQQQVITENLLPSLFGVLAENECYLGPVEGLRAEDQAGLAQLGFEFTQFLGAFPVIYKKAVTGLWLCTAPEAQDITPKELAALKKQFTNFIL